MQAQAPSSPSNRVVMCARLLRAFALVFFVLNCWHLRDLQIDDSFITYRFASRLAHDATLRWNLLEPPVEGYTSFLAVLISAIFEMLRIDSLIAWKFLSAFLVVGSMLAASWGARAVCSARWPDGNRLGVPFVIGALVVANPLAAVHAMSGMETSLYATLLIFLTALALRILFVAEKRSSLLRVMAGGFFLLGLTRPEGVLWAGVAAGAMWVGLPSEDRRVWVRAFIVWFVLPGLVYFLARWAYFGDLLPSTFHAKSGGAARPGAGRLLTYLPSYHEIYKYLRDNWSGFVGVVVVGSALHIGLRRGRSNEGIFSGWRTAAAVAGLFAASALCILYFSSVHMLMGYGRRFLFPYSQTFVLTLILPAILVTVSFLESSRAAGRALSAVLVAALVACFVQTSAAVMRDSRQAFGLIASNTRKLDGYTRTGRALDAVAKRVGRQLTLFHHNMGELMYFAPHWDSIDPVGLVDRHVSRHGFSVDYVFGRNPELMILPSRSMSEITPYGAELFPDISQSTYRDPRMGAYQYLGYFPDLQFGPEGRMHFFLRKDLLAQNPWIAPFLRQRLGLQIEQGFAAGAR